MSDFNFNNLPNQESYTMATKRLAKKRTLESESSKEVPEKQLVISDKNSLLTHISNDGDTGILSPNKKPKHLAYREPENLPSLDPDSFKLLFDFQPNSEVQSAGLESWSVPVSVTSTPSASGLESLGDIIQKYTNASLDSIKCFNIPLEESGTNQYMTTGAVLSPSIDNEIFLTSTVPSSEQALISVPNETDCVDNRSLTNMQLLLPNLSTDENKKNFIVSTNLKRSNNNNTGVFSYKKLLEFPSLSEIKDCPINPSHVGFFAPSELKVKDLPREIQHEDTETFFTCMSPLVVQISVNVTSSARDCNDEYKEYIGTNKIRFGSGFVGAVDERIVKFRCKKTDCSLNTPSSAGSRRSSVISSSFSPNTSFESQSDNSINTPLTPSSEPKHYYYSGVTVHTSRHVIFDKTEADNAFVKFFFDKPNGKGVIKGHVAAIVGVNILQDHVTLHVMSHDKTLFHTLPVLLENAKSSYNEMTASTMKAQYTHSIKNKESWVAVISHPHGLSQAITFGRVKTEVQDSESLKVRKNYDAPLCEGCSGALVITPTLLKLQWPGAVHSSFDPEIGLNYTLDSRSKDLNFIDIGHMNKHKMK
ncbi:dentin sialophosphoprotein [Biomphalaria pfeifferi]|uniref:Dentin sialophosphoprotein n=1 Tax=Biomphalaria pfeifferi TaxID=112525 RepID=A0AAD8F4H3_BIOPF|nr:dentin sialophosphoprotein [Biomphalaria pfeifferi]